MKITLSAFPLIAALLIPGFGSVPVSLHAQALPTPVFSSNATVHDPSVVRDGSTFYVFGSHMASASTTDLMNWTQISTNAAYPNPLIRNQNPQTEFAETLAWAQTNTFWAPDVIRLGDGKYYYYYCACRGDSPRSALGLAVADAVTGPYANVGILLKSGMTGTSEDGTPYDATYHPNVVDPAVFFDQAGKLWMVYGSYSGGIYILEMDPATGRQKPGQGYGKKLLGKYHARIEGPYILYSPQSQYYYLFLSFGGLNANDGYNIRVARSRNPDGPYVDASGADLTNIGGAPGQILAAADPLIAPYGVKLMGSYQFAHVDGEPGATTRGYMSPGHNSAYYDPATGKYFLVFHTRFVGRGEQHEVRVHQMWLNEQGWFVVAPQRYAQETIAKITARQIPGDFKLINHGKAISGTVNTSSLITLHADNSISGAVTGTWQLTGDYHASLALSGVIYRGVFARQWDDDNQVWVLGFTALSDNGTAWWGSKVAALNAVVAPALTTSPASQTVAAEGTVTLTAAAGGAPAPEFQWQKDGVALAAATGATFTLASAMPADTGVYAVTVANFAGAATSAPVILGLSSTTKVVGAGREVGSDIKHQNGNTFDQVLLEGAAEAVRADYDPDPAKNQITRTSFVDLDDDIVQVEFSGPGTLSLVLQDSSGPALPVNYNQDVNYMKGHAGIVITGADEHSNLSVFSVGKATAVNQALFKDGVNYDGIADLAFVAITSTNGKFGGVRTANANYFGSRGVTGIYAPGVQFVGPVYVGNVTAFDAATPMLILGGATGDTLINGGDLHQANGKAVQVKGVTQLKFVAGTTSHNGTLPAQANQARLEQDGVDVTAQIVVNPGP